MSQMYHTVIQYTRRGCAVSKRSKRSLKSDKIKNRDLPKILAEVRKGEFQKALKESAGQFMRGEVSSVAALRAIYRGR